MLVNVLARLDQFPTSFQEFKGPRGGYLVQVVPPDVIPDLTFERPAHGIRPGDHAFRIDKSVIGHMADCLDGIGVWHPG